MRAVGLAPAARVGRGQSGRAERRVVGGRRTDTLPGGSPFDLLRGRRVAETQKGKVF